MRTHTSPHIKEILKYKIKMLKCRVPSSLNETEGKFLTRFRIRLAKLKSTTSRHYVTDRGLIWMAGGVLFCI